MEKEKKKNIANFYNSRKRLICLGCSLLVVFIAACTVSPALSENERIDEEASYGQVTRGDLTKTIDIVGTLEAVPAASLYWESSGIVDSFEIEVGDKVKQGDILMQLTETSLDSSILQAQQSLLEAQAELDNLKSVNTDLITAEQELVQAEYELKQFKEDRDYYNTKGASDDEIDAARDAYYAAQQAAWEKEKAYAELADLGDDDEVKNAAYEEYQAALEAEDEAFTFLNEVLGYYYDYLVETDFIDYDAALAVVEEARVTYNRYVDQSEELSAAEAAVQALENTINTRYIIAPFDGTITAISAVAGDLITESYDSDDTTEAVTISNMDNLMIKIPISEVDINNVQVGQEAAIIFDAISNKEYTGYVSSVADAGEEDDNSMVQFDVWVKLEEGAEQAKPGFTSVVSIVTDEAKDALLVPYDAVVAQEDGSYAVVLEDGTLVPVEIGIKSDAYIEILSGDIEEGDTVILH